MADMDASITFLYLGRRGALGQFTQELMEAAARLRGYSFDAIVSSDSAFANELGREADIFPVPTFASANPIDIASGYFRARKLIVDRLRERQPRAVITLMPHIWTPLLAPAIKRLGIKYVPIIHDARAHPGDRTALVTPWLRKDARLGDLVVTLSRAVAERLSGDGYADQRMLLPLFHPDLTFKSSGAPRKRDPNSPLRILFFGRIMAYKGLSHLLDAVQLLKDGGTPVELGVAGSGDLGAMRQRVEALGAEVLNHWIEESEVTDILARYDAMACPHVEASQSGVAATAFGHRMPVVAMPIGGIAEQVVEGKTGLLARRVSSKAFADVMKRLANEPGLYDSISCQLNRTANDRSMDRFLREVLDEIPPEAES